MFIPLMVLLFITTSGIMVLTIVGTLSLFRYFIYILYIFFYYRSIFFILLV